MMTEFNPTSVLMMVIALLISVGNLLVAYGQSRTKKANADAQAMEVAVKLAEQTPSLEQQLRDTIVQLHEARAEAAEQKHEIQELKEIIALQAEEIRHLKQDKDELASQLVEVRATLQAIKALYPNQIA
jgi:chromosome segregation ATPase